MYNEGGYIYIQKNKQNQLNLALQIFVLDGLSYRQDKDIIL